MGLSLHNSIAVTEGYMGKKSPFIRTPKFSSTDKKGSWKGSKYNKTSISWVTITESLLALYFFYGIYLCIHWQDYGMLPFFIMLTLGFGTISFYSFKHSYEK